jgi:hypothetical protein
MSAHGNSRDSRDPTQVAIGESLALAFTVTINTRAQTITQKRDELETAQGEAVERLNREVRELERQQANDTSARRVILDSLTDGLTAVSSTAGGSSRRSVSV